MSETRWARFLFMVLCASTAMGLWMFHQRNALWYQQELAKIDAIYYRKIAARKEGPTRYQCPPCVVTPTGFVCNWQHPARILSAPQDQP